MTQNNPRSVDMSLTSINLISVMRFLYNGGGV